MRTGKMLHSGHTPTMPTALFQIAAAIPAHTRYDLRLVHPGVTIGRQSTLGVDTLIGAIQPHALGDVRLGEDAVFPAGRSALTLVPDEGEPCSC